VIYVISQIKFILELNRVLISGGFFVVKNVGKSFLNKKIIPMVVRES